MNCNAPKCKKCKIAFNNQDRKPITIICGDTLCEQCYDASLLDNGKQIKCPVDGNIFLLIGKKIYDESILQQLLVQTKFFVYCNLHSLEPADYYYKVDDKLICYKCLAQGGYDSDQFQFLGNGKLEKLGDELCFRIDAFFEPFKLIQKQLSDLKNRKNSVSAERMMEIIKQSQGLFASNDWDTDFIDQFGFRSDSMKSNKEWPRLLDQSKDEDSKNYQEESNSFSMRQRQDLSFQQEDQLKQVKDQYERSAYQKDQEIQSLKQQSIGKVSLQKDQDIKRLQQELQNSQSQIAELKEECEMLLNQLNSKGSGEGESDLAQKVKDLENIKKIMDEELEHKDMANKRLNEQVELQCQKLKEQSNYKQEIAELSEQIDQRENIILSIQEDLDKVRAELKESTMQNKKSQTKNVNGDQDMSQLFDRIEELEQELNQKNAKIKSLMSQKLKS